MCQILHHDWCCWQLNTFERKQKCSCTYTFMKTDYRKIISVYEFIYSHFLGQQKVCRHLSQQCLTWVKDNLWRNKKNPKWLKEEFYGRDDENFPFSTLICILTTESLIFSSLLKKSKEQSNNCCLYLVFYSTSNSLLSTSCRLTSF